MMIRKFRWQKESGWDIQKPLEEKFDLVLVYGESQFFRTDECYGQLKALFPTSDIVGCSTSGNIVGGTLSDGDVVAAAISFSKSSVQVRNACINSNENVADVVAKLAAELDRDDLIHVFSVSDGLLINGSELAKTLENLSIPVTGGLAGDAARFESSWVMANGPAMQNQVVLVGFYGGVKVTYGYAAGWDEFGPERRVTNAVGNIVYEIDHKPALDVYTTYLGELAKELPGSGLRFPLSVRDSAHANPYVRTLLGIDPEKRSLRYAGDVPQGSLCRLMKTDLESLIEASSALAENLSSEAQSGSGLCLIVSCVGRRLVLDQIAEDEIEAIKSTLKIPLFGFYSYGEISPFDSSMCYLHNQTTSLTLLTE